MFVTVVVPTGNVLPLAMLLTRFVTLQLSVALTVKSTLLPVEQIAAWARSSNLAADFHGPREFGQSYVVLTKPAAS